MIRRESRNESSIVDKGSNDDDSIVNQGSFLEAEEDVKVTILRAKELYNESKLNHMLKQDTLAIIKEKGATKPASIKQQTDRALSVIDQYQSNSKHLAGTKSYKTITMKTIDPTSEEAAIERPNRLDTTMQHVPVKHYSKFINNNPVSKSTQMNNIEELIRTQEKK